MSSYFLPAQFFEVRLLYSVTTVIFLPYCGEYSSPVTLIAHAIRAILLA